MRRMFHTCDVFTDRLFTGNPLGVFSDADGLSTEQMQLLARELNLPETAFVLPASNGGDFKVRIFTPAVELPFAGHPTIGAALVLASLGRLRKGADLVFEEGAGPVPVSMEWDRNGARMAWLTAPHLPERGLAAPLPGDLARALSLEEWDIDVSGSGPMAFSAGNPFLFVPLTSRAAVNKAKVATAEWERTVSGLPVSGVYLFCREPEAPWADFRARLFAPDKGIPEDPATGSAAAALPGYILASDELEDGTHGWNIEQGVEMGRPSRLQLEAVTAGAVLRQVRVGGSAVMVSEGMMEVE